MTTRDEDESDPQAVLTLHRRHIDRIDRTIVALIAERARLMESEVTVAEPSPSLPAPIDRVVSAIIAEAHAKVRNHE